MPSTSGAAALPFKNMDIKAAFQAASSRKRKATSPTVQAPLGKNRKLSAEGKSSEIAEVVMLDSEEEDVIKSDSKENADFNTMKPEEVAHFSRTLPLSESAENIIVRTNCESVAKECCESVANEGSENVAKEGSESVAKEGSESVAKEHSESVAKEHSESAAKECSESSSNESVQSVDLNLSVNSKVADCESEPGKEDADLTILSESNNSKTVKHKKDDAISESEPKPKKRKKMTPAEAKAKAEEREQKTKERELKKKELEALKLQKKLELEKRKQQREQEKLEKEEEKKEKERLRLEKKEQEEKEKLQKLKEKEDEKLQRLEAKQEQKKKKEELKLKREEEQKKLEEEKKQKDLKEKMKQERAKAVFAKFFKKENASPPAPQVALNEGFFKPFQVSDDMTLAPVVPPSAQKRFNKSQLDDYFQSKRDASELYLQILKSGSYKDVRQRQRLPKKQISDNDVLILDESAQAELFMKAKLLQFHENIRPPYWGTWRKKSSRVGGRKPFGQDAMFEYDVDSDDEWDEGGPGESLSGTENEQESEDDYEVDNEFFVPHGYLSAEEEKEDDELVENDPEKQKAVLKQKQQEFEIERRKKTTELKPTILGCLFQHGPDSNDASLAAFLSAYAAELISETPILTRFSAKPLSEGTPHLSTNDNSPTSSTSAKKMVGVPEEAMVHLVRLVHGNPNKRESIAAEFQAFWLQFSQPNLEPASAQNDLEEARPLEESSQPSTTPQSAAPPDPKLISKRQLMFVIRKVATYGKRLDSAVKKPCWWVSDEAREKYGLKDGPAEKQEAEPSVAAAPEGGLSIKEFLVM